MSRTTRSTRLAGLLAVLAAAALILSGCGSEPPGSPSVDDRFDAADVTFATDMISHHTQALLMVSMTEGRDLDPALVQLAAQIKAAQTPEIATMTSWLTAWDRPVPDTSSSMGSSMGSMGSGGSGTEMPGMMTSEDLDALDQADDASFPEMWLRMMIQHHEGAIEMAKTEIAEGFSPYATDLAATIVSSQTKEIATMKAMLDS